MPAECACEALARVVAEARDRSGVLAGAADGEKGRALGIINGLDRRQQCWHRHLRGRGCWSDQVLLRRGRCGDERGRAAWRGAQCVGEADALRFAEHSGDGSVAGTFGSPPAAPRRAVRGLCRLAEWLGRREPGLGQKAARCACGDVEYELLLGARERDVGESPFGLEALAGRALLRVDLERAAVG